MAYVIYMTFIETKVFTRQITELISDENYKALQEELIKHPKKRLCNCWRWRSKKDSLEYGRWPWKKRWNKNHILLQRI